MCPPTKGMILQLYQPNESGRNILPGTSDHMENTVFGLEKEGNATTLLIMTFTFFCAHIRLIPPTPPPPLPKYNHHTAE
jgi:hypothetical protein